MHILPILVSTLEPRDQRNVLDVLLQRFHGGGQLERINPGNILDPQLFLGFIRVKSTHETRQRTVLFPRKKATTNDPVRDIHDQQFLTGLSLPLNRFTGSCQRPQKRQGKNRTLGSQEIPSTEIHPTFPPGTHVRQATDMYDKANHSRLSQLL